MANLVGNPRDHPDNANLPNINKQATIIGVTLTFLVSSLEVSERGEDADWIHRH
jgi:hypothetical protein